MAKFSRRRSRALQKQAFAACICGFVGANMWFLATHSPPHSSLTANGEGLHRYRQTELEDTGGGAARGAAGVAAARATAAAADGGAAAGGATAAAAGGGSGAAGGTAAAAAGGAAAAAAGGAAGAAAGAAGVPEQCHAEQDADYDGETVVTWGENNLKDSAEACCAACRDKGPTCNVWVYCGQKSGCAGSRAHKECWLKTAKQLDPLKPRGRRAPGSGWVSGAVYSQQEKDAALERIAAAQREQDAYLSGLRANESLPLVYLDVEIKKQPVGRIEMALFPHISPRAAENFRQLCTGESGAVPNEPGKEGAGKARHFKGAYFYRIIDQFIDQTGVETESVFGGQFKDDPGGLKLKHDRKGLLSMANMGHDTNTAHFSIMMGPAPHLNGDYTIFGQVVSGFDVVDAINALSKGKKDNTATAEAGAQIVDSGQIRKGTIVPDLNLGL